MRIPDIAFFDTFIKYDRLKEKDIKKFTQQLASGKKILTPSDNTVDTVRSLRLSNIADDLNVYRKNIDIVKSTLEIAEDSLRSTVDAMQETRVEIIRLHNTGVLDYEDAQIVKDFLEGMRDYVIDMANVKVGDSYIFSGVRNQITPFDSAGNYSGAVEESKVFISKGVETSNNFSGKDYFGVNEITNKITVVEVIDQIISIIDSGDLSQIHNRTINLSIGGKSYGDVKLLEAFDIGLSELMKYQSKIGSDVNVIDNIYQQHLQIEVNVKNLQSKLEDADYAYAISELEKAKTSYQALLSSIAQNKDLSLLNFIS
ncbi:MAG: flagellar hook protein [Aquificae bacterium]|nr:flagellar hook protein [Aquificota bacterium]